MPSLFVLSGYKIELMAHFPVLGFAMRQMTELLVDMQGFLKAYDSVRANIMSVADEVFGEQPQIWQAYVTGHSLGGALSTLCSYKLANRRCALQSVLAAQSICTPIFSRRAQLHRVLRLN